MMKPLIGLLLAATMATPLSAQAANSDSPRIQRKMEQYRQLEARNQARGQQRAERQAVRQERQAARAQPAARAGRQERRAERQERRADRQARQAQRRDPTPSTQGWMGPRNDPRLREHELRYERQARENALRNGTAQQRREYRRADRVERRDDRREWREDRRDYRRDVRQDRREYRRDRRAWNRGWRNDNRYDWQRYRYSNRNLYRPGRYYAPYRNHSYSRFSIGLTLGAPFLANNYWINDPYQYRLPPAYAGTRWVRYYDDVILVDVYTGEVIDVIYNFFW